MPLGYKITLYVSTIILICLSIVLKKVVGRFTEHSLSSKGTADNTESTNDVPNKKNNRKPKQHFLETAFFFRCHSFMMLLLASEWAGETSLYSKYSRLAAKV